MEQELFLLVMMLVASTVGIAVRRFRFPYTVALVLTGLGFSILRTEAHLEFPVSIHLTEDLLFNILLPILIFEAAFHIELKDFRTFWKSILTMASIGLILGIAISSIFMYGSLIFTGTPVSFACALLTAAILSATDPVGVLAILKEVNAPKRLFILLEGESLLNDGIAVVAFTVVLAAFGYGRTEGSISAIWVIRFLTWEILGAVIVGAALGFFFSWLTSKVDEHLIEITLTTLAAFGSFLIATKMHTSGVIACLVAGMFSGNMGAKHGMSATTRVAVMSFWEYGAFFANSVVFLLIGLEISIHGLFDNGIPILIAWVAIMLARGLYSGGILPIIERLEGRMPKGFITLVSWAGIRGGIVMVLALSIPREFPFRSLIIDMVFGASLLTILVQGTTTGWLLRKLGLVKSKDDPLRLMLARGRLHGLHAASRYLHSQKEMGAISNALSEKCQQDFDEDLKRMKEDKKAIDIIEKDVFQEEYHLLKKNLLTVQKDALKQANLEGLINEAALRRLVEEIDDKLYRMAHHEKDSEGGDTGKKEDRA